MQVFVFAEEPNMNVHNYQSFKLTTAQDIVLDLQFKQSNRMCWSFGRPTGWREEKKLDPRQLNRFTR